MMNEYDALADVYDEWIQGDPCAALCENFYIEFCRFNVGSILELGIGTGRIALTLAQNSKNIIGLDCSEKMLEKCAEKAQELHIEQQVELLVGNFQDFVLKSPVALAILPMRTIGHLLTEEDRYAMFTSVYANLETGGCFVFDHYIFNEAWARTYDRVPRLMYQGRRVDGVGITIWDTYCYSFEHQQMDCCITIEKFDETGLVLSRTHCPLSFSWINPKDIRQLASDAGFIVETVWGDFSRSAFQEESPEQIWVLRKP